MRVFWQPQRLHGWMEIQSEASIVLHDYLFTERYPAVFTCWVVVMVVVVVVVICFLFYLLMIEYK